MDDKRWPALTIQGIFLAANIAFLLGGKTNRYILSSFTLLMLLFTIQAMSNNPKFLYLFPVDINTRIPIPGWDTWILRTLIVLSVFFFYLGATQAYILAILILVVGSAFPIIWDKYIEKHNNARIKLYKNLVDEWALYDNAGERPVLINEGGNNA